MEKILNELNVKNVEELLNSTFKLTLFYEDERSGSPGDPYKTEKRFYFRFTGIVEDWLDDMLKGYNLCFQNQYLDYKAFVYLLTYSQDGNGRTLVGKDGYSGETLEYDDWKLEKN